MDAENVRLADDVLLQRISADEAVALHVGTEAYFRLNEAAVALADRLATGTSVADLARVLEATYGLSADAALADVRALVDALRERGLLA